MSLYWELLKINLILKSGDDSMQRHRRRTRGEQKRGIDALENFSVTNNRIEAHLRHRQLKADLELMKLENRLNQHIEWLQARRLDQLNQM
jgi:hypothetical protein